MPEENVNMNEEDQKEQIQKQEKAQKNERNAANNAKVTRAALDVASKKGGWIGAAATAAKGIDKVTGGALSNAAGKGLNLANKITPGGRLAQGALNKMSESGTADRIAGALNKKNSGTANNKLKSGSSPEPKNNETKKQSEQKKNENETQEGDVSFKTTFKFLKVALLIMIPVFPVIIFCVLFISASQIYLHSVGISQADSVDSPTAEQSIESNGSDNLDEEITDDDWSYNVGESRLTYLVSNTINSNLVFTSNRQYGSADLSELKDFYSGIVYYIEENNIDYVYDFFFKLLYIYKYYNTTYSVELDTALIMSVLKVQNEDMSIVFSSNTKDYDSDEVALKTEYSKFNRDSDLNYISTTNDSRYDIELIARNMISNQAEEKCTNSSGKVTKTNILRDDEIGSVVLSCSEGESYSVTSAKIKKDPEKFKKFLQIFIDKKYINKEGYNPSENYSNYEISNETAVNNLIVEIYDMKQQFEDLDGKKEEKKQIYQTNNSAYWWPIGSRETTEINGVLYAKGDPESIYINSYFGSLDGFRINPHEGIDIGNNGNGPGVINIIASKPGEVVYPTSKSQTQYSDNGYYGNPDGGGYGNYVKIKHSDGTYTIYAHLSKDSITVFAGDVVSQGQVIGKMGTSGSSTGVHLHFEMRVGADSPQNRVDPLNYVDPSNPRTISSGSGSDFSITATILSKEEFISKMRDFYNRTQNQGFKTNFLDNAEEVYNVSLANNVNPELVVVTAGTEQNWTLSPACQYTNNYWGIGITNGNGCNSGGVYDSLAEGIKAYADLLSEYGEYGSFSSQIMSKYEARNSANCDPAGHGLPGTVVGMQSIYSFVGTYRYNPGGSGLGGCYYLNIIYGSNYCSLQPTCTDYSSCSVESATSVCEQNDYTAWQVKKKVEMRYDIFGL